MKISAGIRRLTGSSATLAAIGALALLSVGPAQASTPAAAPAAHAAVHIIRLSHPGVHPDGSNGQQVEFYDPDSSHIEICGTNQAGVGGTCTGWINVTGYYPAYFTIEGWWWVGRVWLYGYDVSAQNANCVVPKSYSSNVYYCGVL